jgi:hypothetical protein
MLIFHGAGYANGQWSYSDTHIYFRASKCDVNNICQYQQMSLNNIKNVARSKGRRFEFNKKLFKQGFNPMRRFKSQIQVVHIWNWNFHATHVIGRFLSWHSLFSYMHEWLTNFQKWTFFVSVELVMVLKFPVDWSLTKQMRIFKHLKFLFVNDILNPNASIWRASFRRAHDKGGVFREFRKDTKIIKSSRLVSVFVTVVDAIGNGKRKKKAKREKWKSRDK